MNTIWVYLLQLLVTLSISISTLFYFRPHLRRILLDLCGTQERAEFWLVFSGILLIGLPLIFGLGFLPLESQLDLQFYEAARQLRANLLGFLLALVAIGGVVSFFALIAPRPLSK
jgi:hypothetical protein